ncbi:MAG: 16S rRNA (cytidine(1402)-2'-O)-methyltransferase [Candidatus Curtissbacteria bacterium]|nr:16S rRNA (cytidine(1402)-2'-O)-methyltransferase [Candidatus Curtissbacteria bacterium]
MAGVLYIVATPIGNLKDITLRAIEILRRADYVLCEDTRVTGKLLHEYEIDSRIVPFNEFNEEKRIIPIIADLTDGNNIALVSDAGTPLVSDPGFKLVRESVARGIKVESIPGPSAAISALVVSGLPTDKFLFVGYLPKKEGKRSELLGNVKKSLELVKSTVIIYESPYRLIKSLRAICDIFGDIDIVICRELTKMHEEVRREKVSELIEYFSKISPKGEFVVLV